MAAMKPRFWDLGAPVDPDRFADWDKQPQFEVKRCSGSADNICLGRRLSRLSLKIKPRALGDFVWTWFHFLLINDRVLEILRRHNVTGFEIRPAEARPHSKRGPPVPRLHELIVTGWAGWVSAEAGLSVTSSCPKCPSRMYHVDNPEHLIDPATWDGSDFFIVWPLPKQHFISDRLAEILLREGVTGIEPRPAEEIEILFAVGAGSLSCYMPEARARELGEPLGIYW
jgi:hypothetical protein